MKLFIDIETIPTDRADVRDYIAAGVSPPGNISKAETIAKWNEESRPQAVEDAVNKTSFDGAFGRICCFGFAVEDEEARTIFSADDERSLLLEVAKAMDYHIEPNRRLSTTVVGHNVSAFDLRFLVQRFIVNNILPPTVLARSAQAKPWETDKVFDTMVQWAGVGNRVSLEKLCLALGIKSPKTELDGSKVWEYVQAGRIAEVATYCKGDVEQMREVFKRMTFAAVAAT